MLDYEVFDKRFFDSEFDGTYIKELPTGEMSRDEWVEVRSSIPGIGGSEVGCVLGLNAYKDPVRLFYEKVGFLKSNFKDNRFAFWGRMIESEIAEAWKYWDAKESTFFQNQAEGNKTRDGRDREGILYNEDFPAQFANIDGEITIHPRMKGHGILEIKIMGRDVEKKWKSGIPPSYICQLFSYMAITGSTYGEFAILIRESMQLKTHFFKRDSQFIDLIRERCIGFMDRVKQGIEVMSEVSDRRKQYKLLRMLEPDPKLFLDYNNMLTQVRKSMEVDQVIKLQDSGAINEKHNLQTIAESLKAKRNKIKDLKEEVQRAESAIKDVMLQEDIKKISLPGSNISFNKRLTVT